MNNCIYDYMQQQITAMEKAPSEIGYTWVIQKIQSFL